MRMRINYFGNIISKLFILNKIFIRLNIPIEMYKDIYIEIQYITRNNIIYTITIHNQFYLLKNNIIIMNEFK